MQHQRRWPRFLFLSVLALAACSEELAPAEPDAGSPGDDGGPPPPSKVTTTEEGDGSFTTVVEATAMDAWVGFDFQSRGEVGETAASRDLSFKRFEIGVNGGTSGTGGVEVAVLPGADFAALTRAPAGGYTTDAASGLAFMAGDGWYAYDGTTHVLSARDIVYVVKSAEGAYFKLAMIDYYDDAGSSGFPTFHWAPVLAPPGSDLIAVDASAATAWTYVSVLNGVVTVTDPTTSAAWDLAFSRTLVATNGGTTGAGAGGARLAPAGASYAAITSATTLAHDVDVELAIPGPPGSGTFSGNPALGGWYDYDLVAHVVSPKDVVFLVRTAAGGYAKLQITAWADGVYQLRLAPVARDAGTHSVTIAATDSATQVHFSLRRGALVTGDAVAAGTEWDLAFSRTLIATNSGTSGPGTGGAADPAAAALGDIVSAAGAVHTIDAMLPVPGPPGSGEYSGNAVLGGWYDYNPTTHVVTPKVKAFLVRTADGGDAKLQITSYADGTSGLDWEYAGAGRHDFQVSGGMP